MTQRTMPPVTLRTYRVDTEGYRKDDVRYEDRPIYFNKAHMDLLAATEKYGMTPAIINTWKAPQTDDLGYLCDKERHGNWKAVGEYLWSEKRGRYIEFKDKKNYENAYGLTRDTLFTKKHQQAVEYLICKRGIKPLDAMAAISEVTGEEAMLIAKFMDVGMTSRWLIAHRGTQMYCSPKSENVGRAYYATAFEFFIRKQHIPPVDAAIELQNLSPAQMKALVDFYADGLRGKDLHSDDIVAACKKYVNMTTYDDRLHKVGLEYFRRSFRDAIRNGKAPAEAFVACAVYLPEDNYSFDTAGYTKNMTFALKHFERGVRADDLPDDFGKPQARRAYASLRLWSRLSVTDAVAELHELDADKMSFLSKHHRHGVHNKDLAGLDHSAKDIVFLMKTYEFAPKQAIAVARTITPLQMGYLRAFAKHGLTVDEAKSLELNSALTSDRKDVALFLVKEKSYDLVCALKSVADKSGEELINLMKEDAMKLNSVRL